MQSSPKTDELVESFDQETKRIDNAHSINIATYFRYKDRVRKGWINMTNVFRSTLIMGTPGSCKTETFVQNFVQQLLDKGFTMAVYDYKSPGLSRIVYTHYLNSLNQSKNQSGKNPSFYAVNFADPRYSSRCNPFLSERFNVFNEPVDALLAAETILVNLNKSWGAKAGEFFVESAIGYLTACIWYMKRYNDRQQANLGDTLSAEERADATKSTHINYCTLPHIVEFATRPYNEIIPLLAAEPECADMVVIEGINKLYEEGKQEQLDGLLQVTQLSLSMLKNPILYWIMSGDTALVDINNPDDPKVLCLGNDPEKSNLFSAPLALISNLLIRQINQKDQRSSALFFDEFPTLYLNHIDNLIATARSNRIALTLTMQDLTQLENLYGKAKAQCIFNTSGTILAGKVLGASAQKIADRLNKSLATIKPAKSWPFFSNSDSSKPPRISPATIEALPYGSFIGEAATYLTDNPTQPVFLGQIPENRTLANQKIAELPLNPQLATLTEEDTTQHLTEHMATIQQEVIELIQRERQRLKLS